MPKKSANGVPIPPSLNTFHRHRQEYQDHLGLTQRVQDDLRADIAELHAQAGWDEETAEGVETWAEDINMIWRILRRHRYDQEKAHAALLTIIAKRVSLGLHRPIPAFPPYSDSPLFYLLPLPEHTDRVGRPVVVLSIRHVRRDEHGKMDDMKSWSWWALEMVRRTLYDYWTGKAWSQKLKGKRSSHEGRGGEGCVMVVDAAGSSYRNLEVELLPTLLSVGHNNFPGVFDAIFVVNAGWTHRSMWGVIKRVLPKSALDKVAFLNNEKDLEKVFDLDRLPSELGGRHPMTFDTSRNPILHHYSQIPKLQKGSLSRHSSRSASTSSIADVYYSARNTPSSSRRQSFAAAPGLTMTAGDLTRSKSHGDVNGNGNGAGFSRPRTPVEQAILPDTPTLSRQASRSSSSGEGPLQRIKSLSNFHLYLSPSRLANIDLLSDSDPDDDDPPPPPMPRRELKPVAIDPHQGGIAARRAQRPPLRLLGGIGNHDVRSYSDRLQTHHAKILQTYREISTPGPATSPPAAPAVESEIDHEVTIAVAEPSSAPALDITSPIGESRPQDVANDAGPVQHAKDISAFSTDANPWYGYPAIKSGTEVRPRYNRNRKRDLVKTLLFLFILRIQSWRDAFERWLGLNKLGTWGMSAYGETTPGHDPAAGLLRTRSSSSGGGGELVKQTAEKDWIWMAITFLLLRGTWTRILAAPLEAVGLVAVRDALGLV